MKNKLLLIGLTLFSILAYGQISFDPARILIEPAQNPPSNAEIYLSDLNGDNAKDLIVVTTIGFGNITIYPNIQGDFTTTQPKLILENQSDYPSGISTMDIDNDGMTDILVCNRYDGKISWFRNLGNFIFSPITLLKSVANGPLISLTSDIDNDGLKDIIINLNSNDSVIWLKNNGNGSFLEPQVIYTDNSFTIKKILVKDLNNDGLPEVMIGDSNNNVYWQNNLGSEAFGVKTQLGTTAEGASFDFVDINNDNYPDYISTWNTTLIKQLNQSGTAFGATQNTTLSLSLGRISFRDIDQDGLTDLVGSTSTGISYLKRLGNGNFTTSLDLINITPITNFIIEDINNDNNPDFIISSYNASGNSKRLLCLTKNTDSYTERVISYYNSSIFGVKIDDLDNDGLNDIVTALRSVTWNKNIGNGEFTLQKNISSIYLPTDGTGSTYNIEIADIDNDNDKDVIACKGTSIEIYYNDGNGYFTLGNTLTLQSASYNIQVADLNGDNFKDIIMTFGGFAQPAQTPLAWIQNLTGTTFGNVVAIGTLANNYAPYYIVSTDIDNDGDNDIISYSYYYSKLHLHRNDGNGIFIISQIANSVSSARSMVVEDFDNDGDKDIFLAGWVHDAMYLVKNNNGTFASSVVLNSKKARDIKVVDINNDGLKDLIGIYADANSNNLYNVFYYVNNGIGFDSLVPLDGLILETASSNLNLGDLNNDNHVDIVDSYINAGKVQYRLNSSTLSIENPEIADNIFIYPIPFTDTVSWKIPYNLIISDVTVYDIDGRLVYSKKITNNSFIDLKLLKKGIYILNLKSGTNSYSRKIVKN